MSKKSSIWIGTFVIIFIILPSLGLISLFASVIIDSVKASAIYRQSVNLSDNLTLSFVILFLVFVIMLGIAIRYSKNWARRLFLIICPVYYFVTLSWIDFAPSVKPVEILQFDLIYIAVLSLFTIFIFTRRKVKEQFK